MQCFSRPQIVVYHAPSTHVSLSSREKFFLPKSLISIAKKPHLSHLTSLSLALVIISHLSSNNPTTQQPNNLTTSQQQHDTTINNKTKRQQQPHHNHNRNNATTTTGQQNNMTKTTTQEQINSYNMTQQSTTK